MPTTNFPYGIAGPGIVNTALTSPLNLPQNTTGTLFTTAGGPILVCCIFGVVTTALGATVTTVQLSAKVGALASVPVCLAGTVTSLAAGTVLMPITSFGTALSVTATAGVIYAGNGTGVPTSFIMGGPGIITATTSANDTGQIQWYLMYAPYSNVAPNGTGTATPVTTVTPIA
jgi:hypothetical protein